MGRTGRSLSINGGEREELKMMSRSSTLDYRYVVRSRIILKLNEGKSYDQVQNELSASRAAVAKWKSRFLEQGLRDQSSRGVKPTYTEQDRARIVQKACSGLEDGHTDCGVSAG